MMDDFQAVKDIGSIGGLMVFLLMAVVRFLNKIEMKVEAAIERGLEQWTRFVDYASELKGDVRAIRDIHEEKDERRSAMRQ